VVLTVKAAKSIKSRGNKLARLNRQPASAKVIVILAGHPVRAAQNHLLYAAHGAVKVLE